MSSKISVHVAHGKYFVWTAAEVKQLRCKHRIVGHLVGTVIGQTHQVVDSGLPLELSRFEVKILLDKDIAQLVRVDHSAVDKVAIAGELKQHDDRVWHEYKEVMIERKKATIVANAARIGSGSGVGRKRKKADADADIAATAMTAEEKEALLKQKLDSVTMSDDQKPMLLPIACPYPQMLSATNEMMAFDDLDQLRFRVFEYFYNEGFYITAGFKFAVDFLVYERDPLIAHATFMVLVKPVAERQQLLAITDNEFTAIEMLIKARLSTQVKKKLLIATVDDHNAPHFVSISWRGKQFRHPKLTA